MSGLFGRFKEAPYKCPECQSDNVEYTNLGKALMTPLAGSHEVELVYKKCNYKWKEKVK